MTEQPVRLSSKLLEVSHLIQSDLFKQRLEGKTRGPAPATSDRYSACRLHLDASPEKTPAFDFERTDALEAPAALDAPFQKNAVFGPLFYLADGSVFVGQMDRERRQGKGLLVKTVAPCLLFEGYFKDDLPHFAGKLYFDNGDVYVGELDQGKMHGRGTYYSGYGKSTFKGQFCADLMDGEGEEHWSDGTLYRGGYSKGKKHGRGVLIANQHTYEGEFSDGHFCGHGSFTLPTRQTFVGHWKASQLQSPATIIYPDGRKFEGEVDRDLQPSGKGTLHTKHKKCSGTFDKGLLEGKAEILDLHSGEIKFGDFRAGRLDAWVTKEDPRPANPSQNPSSQMANPTTIESVMPQQAKLPSEQKPTNSSSKPVQPATAKQLEKKGGCCFC